jgi:hypothetical protein
MSEKVTLKKYFEVIIKGNDCRYAERFVALEKKLDTAIQNQNTATQAAFTTSQKAIDKSEINQTTYNQGHNDLSKKMETQYQTMIRRAEFQMTIDRIISDIKGLRESRSEIVGKREGVLSTLSIIQIVSSGAIAIIGLAIGYYIHH